MLSLLLKSIPNKNKRFFLCSELVELKNGEKSISDKYKMSCMKSSGLSIPILFKESSFKDVNFFNKGILEISCTVL